MVVTAHQAEKAVLPAAFLICEQHSERWGTTWVGRCMLTGCFSEGRTPERAVDCLQGAIDAAIHVAGRYGLTASEWYDSLAPEEPELLAAFCRAACNGIERRTFEMQYGACNLAASIAIVPAA